MQFLTKHQTLVFQPDNQSTNIIGELKIFFKTDFFRFVGTKLQQCACRQEKLKKLLF